MDFKHAITALQKLGRTLKALQSPKKPLTDYQLVEAFQKASAALKAVDFESLARALAEGEDLQPRGLPRLSINGVKTF